MRLRSFAAGHSLQITSLLVWHMSGNLSCAASASCELQQMDYDTECRNRLISGLICFPKFA